MTDKELLVDSQLQRKGQYLVWTTNTTHEGSYEVYPLPYVEPILRTGKPLASCATLKDVYNYIKTI